MIAAARRWLGRVHTTDPLERRTAMAVQAFCIGLSALLVTSEVVRAWRPFSASDARSLLSVIADMGTVALSLLAVVVIRRGHIRRGYALLIGGYVAILSTSIALRGLEYHQFFLLRVFAVLLVLPALLLGRRAMWSTLGAILAAMLVGHLRDLGYLRGHGPLPPSTPPLGLWGQAIAVMLLLAGVLDRFGTALTEAYASALGRQREAERVSQQLRVAKESLESEMERRMTAESMLFQSQKLEAIGRLSGGVAHDFNNLLTAILGYANLSHVSLPPEDPRRAYTEGIMGAAQRGAGLTRQLLTFARRQIVEPRAVWIEDHVREVEPMLRRLIGENVRIELELDHNPTAVMIDPVQLEQVLVNLAVNARDAMPRGGTLRFETGRKLLPPGDGAAAMGLEPGEHVKLRVSDTGDGMDALTLANVFEPFFTTKEVGKGTGLGLATCYGIIRQAGGTITVKSAPGQGATFEILLPAAIDVPMNESATARPSLSGGSESILVVEDDPQVLEIVSSVLSDHGHRVLTASDPEQALALVRDHLGELDLVLTDVMLPGMDGRRLAESLVSMRPNLAVLYMSGHSRDILARQGPLERGIELLPKPFQPQELLEKVRAVLDSRQASA